MYMILWKHTSTEKWFHVKSECRKSLKFPHCYHCNSIYVGSGRYINATTFFAQVKKCGNSLLAGNGYVNHGQERNFLFLLLKGLT